MKQANNRGEVIVEIPLDKKRKNQIKIHTIADSYESSSNTYMIKENNQLQLDVHASSPDI
jgi:hypothetical protein